MYGPRNPISPTGPAQDVVRTGEGAYVRQQEFADGWIYEVSVPVGYDQPMTWGETGRILFSGQLMATFTEEGRHYITVWLRSELHHRLYPNGPLSYQFMDDASLSAWRARMDDWIGLHHLGTDPCRPDLRIAG